jgi:hypothetical protein
VNHLFWSNFKIEVIGKWVVGRNTDISAGIQMAEEVGKMLNARMKPLITNH